MNRQFTSNGFYLPLFSLMIWALLGVIAFAIDGGRLFLYQGRLQRAVDAATYAAMPTMARRPEQLVRENVRLTLSKNMDMMGFSGGEQDRELNIVVGPVALPSGALSTRRIQANARARVDFYLLSVIPYFPRFGWVTAGAQAGLTPMAVTLVLDVSSSMGEVSGGVEKLTALKIAAKNFVRSMDDGDFISVVSYASSAMISLPLIQLERRNNLVLIDETIDSLLANGQTCIACGMKLALEEYQSAPSAMPPDISRFVVLLSDGVPMHEPENNLMLDSVMAGGLSCGYEVIRYAPRPPPVDNTDESDETPQTYQGGADEIQQTVSMSDLLRLEGLTILTIGLGRDNYGDCDSSLSHSWQSGASVISYLKPRQANQCFVANDRTSVRSYLMHRLANDQTLDLPYSPKPNESPPPLAPPFAPASGTEPSPGCETNPNAGNCACIPRIGATYPRGIYINSPTAAQLDRALERAFHFIKAPRLIA